MKSSISFTISPAKNGFILRLEDCERNTHYPDGRNYYISTSIDGILTILRDLLINHN